MMSQTSRKLLDKKVHTPMEGVRIWDNPKNKLSVFELHYTADPEKRTNEWKKQAKAGMPRRKWLQEYELQWESWSGKPVYGDYSDTIHGVAKPIDPSIGLPLLRGWDFGLTPSAVVCQLENNRLSVLREFTSYNKGIDGFSDEVLQFCKMFYPNWADFKIDWLEFYDPAGNTEVETNKDSCARVLKRKGLRLVPGAVTFEERRAAVEHFLTRRDKYGPCFQIARDLCPTLIRGFKGGYRYPDEKNIHEIETNRMRPLKDEHSHPHDALQYVATGILKGNNRKGIDIPIPYYSWSKRRY